MISFRDSGDEDYDRFMEMALTARPRTPAVRDAGPLVTAIRVVQWQLDEAAAGLQAGRVSQADAAALAAALGQLATKICEKTPELPSAE